MGGARLRSGAAAAPEGAVHVERMGGNARRGDPRGAGGGRSGPWRHLLPALGSGARAPGHRARACRRAPYRRARGGARRGSGSPPPAATRRALKKLLKTLKLAPPGDAAVYAEFGDQIDLETNQALQALAAAVRERGLPWIRDIVPALCGLALHFDPDHPGLPAKLLEECEALLADAFKSAGKFEDSGRMVEV